MEQDEPTGREADSGAPATGADGSTDPADEPRPRLQTDHPLVRSLILEPSVWRLWPAVAVLRWLLRRASPRMRRIVYRSQPRLSFASSEIDDVVIGPSGIDLMLAAPSLVGPGSSLPAADIARIIEDYLEGGGLSRWLDGQSDRLLQVVEHAQTHNSASFAVATGGHIKALDALADLCGRRVPLAARPGGQLEFFDIEEEDRPADFVPFGAIGLAGLFVGTPSASGLAQLVEAFTGLRAEVREFTGAEVPMLRSARIGASMGGILGSKCWLPSAGIDVIIHGGSAVRSQAWAGDARRRRSLGLLARSYIGNPSIVVRMVLVLAADNAPPATLDGDSAFGGLAVLGESTEQVSLPLAI